MTTAGAAPRTRRRLLVPEVVQTSAMDCGPASLKAVLEGFGVPVSYGRLREACQTDVDGTSIDTLEALACGVGLVAEQVLLPPDLVLWPEAAALPAIVVVTTGGGFTHFVVVWARHGPFLQIMDPGVGRRFTTCDRFLAEVFRHEMPVPAAAWREWAASPTGARIAHARLERLAVDAARARAVVEAASAVDGPWALARIDATLRLVESLVASDAVARGPGSAALFERMLERAAADGEGTPPDAWAVPRSFWSIEPRPAPGDDGEPEVLARGAVLVTFAGVDDALVARLVRGADAGPGAAPDAGAPPLPSEVVAALREPAASPLRDLARLLRPDGLATPALVASGLVVLAAAGVVEALLLRSLLEIGGLLGPFEHRLAGAVALVVFLAAMLLLDLPLTAARQWLGRHLESRLRVAFLTKVPRLGDRYLQSRPTSDMAERAHTIHVVRGLPALAAQLVRAVAELAFTVAALVWLDPRSAPLAIGAAALAIGLPLAAQPALVERDLRFRSHAGALMRFYLDALLGLVAIRAHGAERSVRREHEGLLVDWAATGRSMVGWTTSTQAVQLAVSLACVVALFAGYVSRAPGPAGALLFVYWAFAIPWLGAEIGALVAQYPALRSALVRLLEPIGALEPTRDAAPALADAEAGAGARVDLAGVSVVVGGHAVLRDVSVSIAPGEHVAVVGPSGAGKSTLVGLLLGWHRAAAGAVLVDGAPLDAARLDRLRRDIAWVDPGVHLWNATLLDNLTYGAGDVHGAARGLEAAELHRVLEGMPAGLQTRLGESGALVSGGEGQRVRFGRAVARGRARLALLDEPFRGLDRAARARLLDRARAAWAGATLICVTHDLGDAARFDRVLVIEDGAVVEDGAPGDLAAREDGRFRAQLEAERALGAEVWGAPDWRRVQIEGGLVAEEGTAG